jgi:hypothetical protein
MDAEANRRGRLAGRFARAECPYTSTRFLRLVRAAIRQAIYLKRIGSIRIG